MMKVSESVLDRIEQSFGLFKSGFKILFIPFLIYYLVSFIFSILVFIFVLYSGLIQSVLETMNYDSILAIFSNSKIVLLATIFILFFIVYLIIYMPFIIYSIRIIGNIYNNKAIGNFNENFNENFKFALSRFLEMMKTYWYIFAYVALIPSFFFILGGGIFNISYFMDLDPSIKSFGGLLMIIGLVLFIVFSIYRGLKTNFSLYSAIEKDEYTKENFDISVKITDNNWWRILGNLLLVGLIISMLSGVASNVVSLFFSSGAGYMDIISDLGKGNTADISNDPGKIKDLISSFMNSFSFFNYFVSNFFQILISTVGKIFTIIFIYLFYRRLLDESGLDNEKKVLEEDIITAKNDNTINEL